jgi:hypothetical protein
MTTQSTIASLKEALQQPFAPETIQFLPKEIRKENGKQVCSALPYANKRVYEDRLNALVFGEWSTPPTQPYAQGNKLIIPVTVIILGVAHTDYGEAFMTTTGKNGSTREDENTATEAYSQAFRRACAKFLLGRYLYDLPKLTLPYDPAMRQIAISKAERIAWVEKLYQAQGLLPKRGDGSSSSSFVHTPPFLREASTQQATSLSPTSEKHLTHPVSYPNETFLDWVCHTVNRDPQRIAAICTAYGVTTLSQLSATQRQDLTRRQRLLPSGSREPQQAPSSSETTPPAPTSHA